MPDYTRLVSYIYNYEEGLKRNNVGYARVEARNGQCKCTLHITAPSISDKQLKAYLFTRKEGDAKGILLGTFQVRSGVGDYKVLTESAHIMNSPYSINDMGGIVCYLSDNKFFATEWDDVPITVEMVSNLDESKRVNNIPVVKEEQAEEIEAKVKPLILAKDIQKDLVKDSQTAEVNNQTAKVAFDMNPTEVDKLNSLSTPNLSTPNQTTSIEDKDAFQTVSLVDNNHNDINYSSDNPYDYTTYKQKEEHTESWPRYKVGKFDYKAPRGYSYESIFENKDTREEDRNCKEERKELVEEKNCMKRNCEEPRDIKEDFEYHDCLNEHRNQEDKGNYDCTVNKGNEYSFDFRKDQDPYKELENIKCPPEGMYQTDKEYFPDSNGEEDYFQAEKENLFDCEDNKSMDDSCMDDMGKRQSYEDHPLAKRLYNKYPRMYPFEDNDIAWCVKIEPQDIGLLPMETWVLGNNSFLLHGFYSYRHLIFARINDRNGLRYILGVPGIYHNREKFMARMFGFDNFKCIKRKELKTGEFGYWYIPIILN